MATNLVISGGPLHDFEATTTMLVEILAEEGVQSTVFTDPRAALRALAANPHAWDLVTVNGLHGPMSAERHAHLRDDWSFTLRDDEAETLERYVVEGGGLLALHAAAICFDGDPRWAACLGGTWNWERSSHPPHGPAQVVPTAAGRIHPLTAGIAAFTTIDEVYGFLDHGADLVPLLTSAHGGTDHPVLWARTVGSGRVVTDLLGHDAAAVDQPDHREVLRRTARWLAPSIGPARPTADREANETTP